MKSDTKNKTQPIVQTDTQNKPVTRNAKQCATFGHATHPKTVPGNARA